MKKIDTFIKKLILFTLLFIILDFAIGSVLEHFYFSKKSLTGGDNKLYYSLNKTTADILIFGASTAIHEYIPQIIEDSLGVSCYNTGWNGTNVYFTYTILNSVLQRYAPKIVIFDMTAWDFIKADDDFDKIPELYPYYYTNKCVKDMVDFSGKYERFKMLSKTYRFNSKLLYILTQNLGNKNTGEKGYEPIYGYWNYNLVIDTLSVEPYDSTKFSYFDKFVSHASEKGCRVIVVSPPVYRKYLKDQYSKVESYLKSKNVEFWNFRNDTAYFNHREYFYDYVHLNNAGAVYFTSQIASHLKKLKGT